MKRARNHKENSYKIMRHYEQVVILQSTLSDEETENQIQAIQNTITDNGGEIVFLHKMGIKKLAYPINKNKRGLYIVVYFKLEPKHILEVERKLRFNESVLKFLTIKYQKAKEVKAFNSAVAKLSKVGESKNSAE